MYYHHTTLANLSQDDIFSIMLYGGGITLFIFIGLIAIMIWEFRYVGKDVSAPILSTILKAISSSIALSIMFLIGIVMFMTVYIGVFTETSTLNPAEAIEWFLHTQWTNMSLELPYHLDAIEPYGEDAITQAQTLVGIIYVMYLVLIGTFTAMNITIISYAFKVGKMAYHQNDVSGYEYSYTTIMVVIVAIIYLGLNIEFFNKSIDTILSVSDKLVDTTVSNNKTHLERLYGEIVNIDLANSTSSLSNHKQKDTNDLL